MRRYWEIDQTFAQPSESLLKKNLKESVKKQKEKGNKLEPVVISGRAILVGKMGEIWKIICSFALYMDDCGLFFCHIALYFD